jgi:ABC-type uncharacterized transport system substrate-binding protein
MQIDQLKRRKFITLIGGAAAWPLAARAQQVKVWRIGVLETTSIGVNAANFAAFRQGLRDLGYDEGKNLVIEYRSADSAERFPDLATELVRLKVDPIVLRGAPAVLAAKSATYAAREFVDAGGLMAYAVSFPDLYHRAATYADKILKGAKPADLPVQQPTKFELVINLKTAKALGLEIPPTLLARADEVFE